MASALKLYLCRNINHRMSCALACLALSMYFKYLTVSGLSATHMVLHTSINEISWFPTQSQLSHSFSIVHLESLHFALNNFLLAMTVKELMFSWSFLYSSCLPSWPWAWWTPFPENSIKYQDPLCCQRRHRQTTYAVSSWVPWGNVNNAAPVCFHSLCIHRC